MRLLNAPAFHLKLQKRLESDARRYRYEHPRASRLCVRHSTAESRLNIGGDRYLNKRMDEKLRCAKSKKMAASQRKEGLCVSVEGELWYNTRLKNRKKEDESLQIRRFVAC